MLAAGMILTIMVLPLIIAVSREVMLTVPTAQREAMLALGATRWEVIRYAVLPFSRVGILGGIILALGRALGETMAVTMVIGNQASQPSLSLFQTGLYALQCDRQPVWGGNTRTLPLSRDRGRVDCFHHHLDHEYSWRAGSSAVWSAGRARGVRV